MNNILFINACFKDGSRTKELAQHLLNRLNGNVETVDLYNADIKPVDENRLTYRDQLLKSSQADNAYFALAHQFANADTIVVAAPYWDLMFPSILKVYLENITVCGITFRYSEKGIPQTLCKAKRLYYVTTSGGFINGNNFGFDYIKALSTAFFGINDVKFFSAQGLDIYGADIPQIMQEAICNIDNEHGIID